MSDTIRPAEPSTTTRRTRPRTATSSSAAAATEAGKRRDVHCVMQGKGGVGKSFIASLLIQWHQANNLPVMAFDTDPINRTLSAFPALAAQPIRRIKRGQDQYGWRQRADRGGGDRHRRLRHRQRRRQLPADGTISCSNEIASILEQYNRRLVLHTVVVGGQVALDTLRGMAALLGQFPPSVPVVVWVNEYNGPFEADGLAFEETQAYRTTRRGSPGWCIWPRSTR